MKNFGSKRAQVTIFIILALVIVGAIIIYFTIDLGGNTNIPSDLRPAYDYYLTCIEEHTAQGISLLGEQGGYIELPDFEPGSAYRPFSSQLDFFGQGVPYWMYVSGNNIVKEQVPSKSMMQKELGEYVMERLEDCDFTDLESSGFDVYLLESEGNVESVINERNVEVTIEKSIVISKGENLVTVKNHGINLNSKLGKFYDMAVKVYDYEREEAFLENYALDVMRLYAPVTGVELTCTPKVFVKEEIAQDIANGLQANVGALKLKGDYFTLSSKERDYFVSDAGFNIDENMNFMYLNSWPTRIEIYGDEVVEPVGLQEGLGVLGFCYVPYHFVYDIDFPVMVQFFEGDELFQFPVSVIVQKSRAREALTPIGQQFVDSPVCEYMDREIDVFTYDVNLNPVESRISFRCLDAICEVGKTSISGSDAYLEGKFPACVNGEVKARAEGYSDAKAVVSTNGESEINLIMNKKYNLNLDLGNVDKAMVSFRSPDYSASVLYPEMNSIELVEGYYNVTVQVYSDSSLKLPAINERKCVDVPESGVSGLFGVTKEKCFDVNIPSMDVNYAIVGGGSTREYITEGQLESAQEININVPLFGVPNSMEKLHENSLLVEDERVYISYE